MSSGSPALRSSLRCLSCWRLSVSTCEGREHGVGAWKLFFKIERNDHALESPIGQELGDRARRNSARAIVAGEDAGAFEPDSDNDQSDERKAGDVKSQAEVEPAGPDLQFEPPGGVGADREFPLCLGTAPVREDATAIDQPPRAGILVDEDGLPRLDL